MCYDPVAYIYGFWLICKVYGFLNVGYDQRNLDGPINRDPDAA